jgi:membrane protease YdiL (CAAX protease family)
MGMYDIHSRPGATYGRGLLILFGSVGIGLFIGSLVSMGLWAVMTGRSIFTLQQDMANPAYTNALRMMQLVSTFFIFFIPALITAYLLSKKPYRLLGFNFYFSRRQVGMVILIMVAALPLVGALGELNKMIPLSKEMQAYFEGLEEQYAEQVKVLSQIGSPTEYLLSLLVMAIAPAIFEETFFRGGMQNLLQRITNNPWIAIGVTSIVFSAIHFSFYGFIPRLALGIVLGMIFYYTGSLWLSIFGHFFNNALVVTQIYVYLRQGKSVDDAMKETYPLYWGLVGLAALAFLFIYFKRVAAEDRKTKVPAEDVALEDQWMT